MKTQYLAYIILAALISTVLISSPSLSVQTGGASYQNKEQTSADLKLGATIEVGTGRTTIKSVPYLWPEFNGVSNSFLKHSDTTGILTWEPLSASSLNLDSAKIFIGNGAGQAAARTISGDFTINNSALATISPNAVTTLEIADGSITTPKPASTLLLPVNMGGTGATQYPQYEILRGNGTSSLLSTSELKSSDAAPSFMVKGVITSIGTTGAFPSAASTLEGTRFMWIPSKKALRAGMLDASHADWWNEENIGTRSIVHGINSFGGGANSFVLGQSGATGEAAIAIAIGNASSYESIAIGLTGAANNYATAVGFLAGANGERSFALGGAWSTANADNSYVLGGNIQANAEHNMIIGKGEGPGIIPTAKNTSPYTLWVMTNSEYPSLIVGEAPAADSTGNVAIGNIALNSKLNVDGDVRLADMDPVPSPSTNKLYNGGGTIYWSGISLSTSGSLPAYGTSGNIIVDSGTIWTSQTLSGAVTIDSTGMTVLSDDSITNSKINNAAVTNAKIADNQVTLGTAGQKVNGTLSVANGGTAKTSYIEGSVVFAGETAFNEDNSNLFWDRAANKLGIKKNSSIGAEIDLAGAVRTSTLDASGGIKITGRQYGAFTALVIDPADGITSVNKNALMITAEAGSQGEYPVTANPQIAAGLDGQVLKLTSSSDEYMIKLSDGNGLKLSGGVPFTLGKKDMLELIYVQEIPAWVELERSDN